MVMGAASMVGLVGVDCRGDCGVGLDGNSLGIRPRSAKVAMLR